MNQQKKKSTLASNSVKQGHDYNLQVIMNQQKKKSTQ